MRRETSVHALLSEPDNLYEPVWPLARHGAGDLFEPAWPLARHGARELSEPAWPLARHGADGPRTRAPWRTLKTEAVMRLNWATLAAAGVAMLCWAVIAAGVWVTARAWG